MKKIFAILALSALTALSVAPVLATTHAAKTGGSVQPNTVGGVFFNTGATMTKFGTMGANYDASWYGGNGYYAVTCYYEENGANGVYSGTNTSNEWTYIYNTTGDHWGYLTIGSGGATDTTTTNSITY